MRLVLALAVALAGSACAPLETHRFAIGGARPRTSQVDVLEGIPTRPHLEVGFVQALGYGGAADGDAVVRALVGEGRAMGCDAIARVRLDGGGGVVHGAGVCVRWVELPPEGPAATPSP
jgi:hypothetical protein